MKRVRFLVSAALFACLGATAAQAHIQSSRYGHWPYGYVVNALPDHDFVRTSGECLPTRSWVARHCTVDYRRVYDNVRLSVAVRNTNDDNPDFVYAIHCTANCFSFRWQQIGM